MTQPAAIRVLVVDDHTLFRRGLISLLSGDARFEVVGEVKAVLDGQPWIELVGVRPLTEQIGDGSLVHAGRGFGAWERGEWRRAV